MRASHAVGVVHLDLDGFKRVNVTRGHAAGDALLVSFAGHLQRLARPLDLAARLAGDEFCLLMPAATERSALAERAERLRAALEAALVPVGPGSVSAWAWRSGRTTPSTAPSCSAWRTPGWTRTSGRATADCPAEGARGPHLYPFWADDTHRGLPEGRLVTCAQEPATKPSPRARTCTR